MKRRSIIVAMIYILCVIAIFDHADIAASNNNLYNRYGQFNSSFYNWNFQNNAWLTNNLLLPRTSMSNIFNYSYTYNPFNQVFQSPMSFLYSNPNSRANYGYNYQYNMPSFTKNYWAGATPWTSSFTNPLAGTYIGNLYPSTLPVTYNFLGLTTINPVSNVYQYKAPLFSGGSGSNIYSSSGVGLISSGTQSAGSSSASRP